MPGWRQPTEWSGTLFAYVDVRDLAVAFRLVVEAPPEAIQDEVFNVAADDALATEPSWQRSCLASIRPAGLASGLTGRQSMVSAARIASRLGLRPAYSWRDVLGGYPEARFGAHRRARSARRVARTLLCVVAFPPRVPQIRESADADVQRRG